MIKHFLLIAWRNFQKRKSLSMIQIMCLSIGMTAFILVASYIRYEKDWDKFNVNFDRIYRVQSYKINDRLNDVDQVSVPVSKYLRDHIPEIENAITIREVWGEYLSSDTEHIFYEPDGFQAPTDVFEIFSFHLLQGNKHEVLDDPNSIVVSQTMAEKYFPGQNAMGKVILDPRKKELIITGIMEDIPEQSVIQASYFKSNVNLLKENGENWTSSSYRSIVLLNPNASPTVVSEKIKNVLNEHDKEAKKYLYLRPLSKLHLNAGPRDDKGTVIFFYSFIGILTLLLACVSFMNLTTSFSTLRTVEIGVRKVSGSSKSYLRWQFLSEAIILAFISFVFSILLSYLILPFFNNIVNRHIELQLFNNLTFLLFLIITVLLTGIIAGSYPALIISSFKPVSVLKGNNPFKKGKITGLRSMVYFQFILSIVLITSSLWMYQQVNFLKNKDLGFQKENLLHCNLPSIDTDISYQYLKERILENPGIENMSISYNTPLLSVWGREIKYEEGSNDDFTYIRWNSGDQNYLKTMSMELTKGRDFSENFSDIQSCLINETAVKTFGWKDPIGKWIDIDGKHMVVGVIKDFNIEDVHNPILPFVLNLHEEKLNRNNHLNFKINPSTKRTSIEHIDKVLKELFPNVLFEVKGFDDGINRVALKIWTNAKDTFAFFAILAVIIAILGLFGLVVFSSQRRVKEIGIRKVHGAEAYQILPLLTKQFVILVLIANINVIPLAYLLERVTPGAFKYHFTISDLCIVFGISVLVTLISSGYQSIKASGLNPIKALRYE